MKKGIIVNFKRLRRFDFAKINKIFLLLCALFVSGIAIGSILYSKNASLSDFSKNFFESFISLHKENVFIKKFFSNIDFNYS